MKSKMWFMSNAGQPACDIMWITFLPSMSLYAVPFSFGFKADLSQSTLIINPVLSSELLPTDVFLKTMGENSSLMPAALLLVLLYSVKNIVGVFVESSVSA